MHTGHCLCGAIRVEIAGEFLHAYYCHCSRCRRASASSFATNGFVRNDAVTDTAAESFSYKPYDPIATRPPLTSIERSFATRN